MVLHTAGEHLEDLLPEAPGLLSECSLVRIDIHLFPDQISFMRFHHLCAFEKLPAKEEYRSEEDHHVIREEAVNSESARKEGTISVAAKDKGHENHADPCAVGLEISIIRHDLAIYALSLNGSVEEQIRDADDDVINDLSTSDDVDKPSEYLGRPSVDIQEA